MKFNIPTIGTRITIAEDLEIELGPGHSEFAIFKGCQKNRKMSQTRDNQTEFEYYEVVPSRFTIPKGTILKIETMIPGTMRHPTGGSIRFSISETSLEKESGNISISSYRWRALDNPRKIKNPKFYLKAEQFNSIDFEFAV